MVDWYLIKIALTFFVFVLVPIYWRSYGPENFLWLSDIGLFLTVLALWIDSRLLMSIAALETFLLELLWILDFLLILLFRVNKIGLADYMFNSAYSYMLRFLSLFHIFMPFIWFYYLKTYDYDISAIFYAIPLFWLILLLCYALTDSSQNINWVFLPKVKNLKISQFTWLCILFIGVPLFVFLPVHFLFKYLFNGI